MMALMVCLVAESRAQMSDCKHPSGVNQRMSSTNSSLAVSRCFLAYSS